MVQKVLVVDDATFMREIIKGVLSEDKSIYVIEAENGTIALERYRDLNPDLIILDIAMPDMSGIDVLEEIREKDKKTKVIICSAIGTKNIIMECAALKVSGFIVKPFEKAKLLETVKKTLKD
jgi:two-component system, chemotaxis family, chemotaxis protein CheY